MPETRQPLFVARRIYRQRRLQDMTRILPCMGGLLFLLPLLWPRDPGTTSSAGAGLYIFAAWFALICVAFALARPLRAIVEEDRPVRDRLPAAEDEDG